MRDLIFISYSHEDLRFLEEFQTMLAPMQHDGVIDAWDDTRIKPGENWRDEIKQALKNAKVAVLLVSPAFLASDFIAKHELPPLLKAAKEDGLKVFWVCLRHCLYDRTEIESYHAIHAPNQPLVGMSPHMRGVVWKKLCQALGEVTPPLIDDDKTYLLKTAYDLIVVILQKSDAATRKLGVRFGMEYRQIVECRKWVAKKP